MAVPTPNPTGVKIRNVGTMQRLYEKTKGQGQTPIPDYILKQHNVQKKAQLASALMKKTKPLGTSKPMA